MYVWHLHRFREIIFTTRYGILEAVELLHTFASSSGLTDDVKQIKKKQKVMKRYNPDMQLTEDFLLGEFIEHETANRLGIDNTPEMWEVVVHLRQLCREVLQPLRDHAGHEIHILSGYHTEQLNEALHTVGNSMHLYGCAADVQVPDIDTARSWYYWIVNHLDFDQCFLEHNRRGDFWLHVSYRPDYHDNRHQSWFYRRSLSKGDKDLVNSEK